MAFDDLELPSGVFDNVLGGSATYAAFAASTFAPVRLVAVVGDDFPEDALADLGARGVHTGGVERARGRTFRWRGRYASDLATRTSLDTQLNVFADFQPKIPASYLDSTVLMLGNIHPALQLDVLGKVTAAGRPRLIAADTMNFWIQGEPTLLAKVLASVDLLIVNDEEARELSGQHNLKRAARDILARGPKSLVVKRGEHGALLFDDRGVFAAPGFPLEDVVDPTGAGDSFAGGLLGSLVRSGHFDTLGIRRAILHGTATASYCVEAVGTRRVRELTTAGVRARVADIAEMYEFGRASLLAD
jgi:sugar/nucleoside kinase (ribokinase family)